MPSPPPFLPAASSWGTSAPFYKFLGGLLRNIQAPFSRRAIVGSLTASLPLSGGSPAAESLLSLYRHIVMRVPSGSALGFLIPWLLFQLRLDQASSAAPILPPSGRTGLLIYFYLAAFILGLAL